MKRKRYPIELIERADGVIERRVKPTPEQPAYSIDRNGPIWEKATSWHDPDRGRPITGKEWQAKIEKGGK